MKNKVRVIPRLDVKNNTIVKGINLEGLRVVGVPGEASLDYYLQGADEILYMDAVASLYERNSLKDIVREVAKNVFVPLTVGGGIRTINDIRDLLRSGADKVAINTAAIRRPNFIREASLTFGSQCIVGSIEAIKKGPLFWEAYIETGREATGVNVLDWAMRLEELGAGEILITSINNEGMQQGYEIDLVREIMRRVSIPVIACGGCGKPDHAVDLIHQTGVEAIACASIFHYKKYTIEDVKQSLVANKIAVSLHRKDR
jgi:cyclase